MKRETRQTQELQLTSSTAFDEINRRFKQLNKQIYQLHNQGRGKVFYAGGAVGGGRSAVTW